MFRKDYAAMTAQGVEFTPEDVIRLNALAVKVKLAQRPFEAMHHPRALVAYGLLFREPTIAHELWVERVAAYIDIRNERNFRFIYGFALTREASRLPDPLRPRRVIRKVFGFATRRLARLTVTQLADAIDYCVFGADWTVGELPPPKESGKSKPEGDGSSPSLALLAGLWARRIPLSLDDARRMTASQIFEAIARADARDGEFDPEKARHDALGAYVRAREEIRERSISKGAAT